LKVRVVAVLKRLSTKHPGAPNDTNNTTPEMISGEFWHWTLRSCPGSVAAPRATHQQQASGDIGDPKKMSVGVVNDGYQQWQLSMGEVMLKYEKPIGFGDSPSSPSSSKFPKVGSTFWGGASQWVIHGHPQPGRHQQEKIASDVTSKWQMKYCEMFEGSTFLNIWIWNDLDHWLPTGCLGPGMS
jgi:hypothetical protein